MNLLRSLRNVSRKHVENMLYLVKLTVRQTTQQNVAVINMDGGKMEE